MCDMDLLMIVLRSCPHPSALARTHNIAYMISGLIRAAASAISGVVYSYGSSHGISGLAWWIMSMISASACLLGSRIEEGNGHEIQLAGDAEDDS